ncbi:MAG: endolytic transglycosylase MltG [Jiangellaceae bacterium]|nr:endolytic transglycosylase MltG [Jiangellaceae bacterium]
MSHLGLTMDDGPRTTRAARRRQHRRRRRHRVFALVAVLVSLAVVGGLVAAVAFGGRAIFGGVFAGISAPAPDYPGPGSGQVVVTIEPGVSLREMGSTLTDAGVVASQEAFVEAAEKNPAALGIQAGQYTLRKEMRAADAVLALIESTTVLGRVVIPEGFGKAQIIERIVEQAGFPVEEVQAAVEAAPLPAYSDGDAEGFLFPATYDIKPDTTAASLVKMMVDRFGQAAESVGLEAGAAARNLTPRQAVTLASIIQREVHLEEDMADVAQVAYNRLSGACNSRGIPAGLLQMDSTVMYAAPGQSDGVFTSDQLRSINSPYNTYRMKGLPPGPIASPGELALQAALNPSNGDYCFFSAVNLDTGETKFAVTTEEHAKNVAELQAFCRESDLC